MRIFAEVKPRALGRCVHRIASQLRRTFEELGHETVETTEQSELIVYYLVDDNLLFHFFDRNKPYLLIVLDRVRDMRIIRGSQGMISHVRFDHSVLQEWHGEPASDVPFRYLRAPYGFDPSVFYSSPTAEKKYALLTTGYNSDHELIDQCHQACNQLGRRFVHVGGRNVSDLDGDYFEGIADAELRALYQQSQFVAGTRIADGFELPIIEGLACGARPICLVEEPYLKWFAGHVMYATPTVQGLKNALRASWPVSAEEFEWVQRHFAWEVVREQHWKPYLRQAGF